MSPEPISFNVQGEQPQVKVRMPITCGGIVEAFYALPHERRICAEWVAPPCLIASLKALLDSDGRSPWRDAINVAAPPLFLGCPVRIDDTLTDVVFRDPNW